MKRNLICGATGFVLFCFGYLLINQQILVQAILYRAAASDYHSAVIALVAMAVQATALLIGLIVLPRRLFGLLLIAIGISASTNLIFSQILDDIVDLAKFDWLLTEAGHARNAAGQFAFPAAVGLARAILALGFLAAARKLIRMGLHDHRDALAARPLQSAAIALLLLPSILFGLGAPGPIAAERNVYNFAFEKLTIPSPPPRGPVKIARQDGSDPIEKILWIVDESVGHDAFARLVRPDLATHSHVDFGRTAAMANCSAPAHVALRSGIDVLGVNPLSDLRTTPSIWSYARKAGYRTILIDGQVTGPPQNLLLPPEAGKIDEILPVASGMQTDLAIAKDLNNRLKGDGRAFVYAVLRGVHFQYSDHFPAKSKPGARTLGQQYDAAIAYSKKDFFDTLLAGVDRETVAIIYTSDHGQNVQEGVIPHCSAAPEKSEFAVPLVAFLPATREAAYRTGDTAGRSASQIFPSTLAWMGYDRSAATAAYDNTLARPTRKFVWFGRAVIPLRPGDRIQVTASDQSLVE